MDIVQRILLNASCYSPKVPENINRDTAFGLSFKGLGSGDSDQGWKLGFAESVPNTWEWSPASRVAY